MKISPQPLSLFSPLLIHFPFSYTKKKQVLLQLYSNKIFNFRQFRMELIGWWRKSNTDSENYFGLFFLCLTLFRRAVGVECPFLSRKLIWWLLWPHSLFIFYISQEYVFGFFSKSTSFPDFRLSTKFIHTLGCFMSS